MSDADELLRSGDLDGARSALIEVVRRKPDDIAARLFLFQLLAVLSEWDKAAKQLATLAQLSPEAQMLSVVYGQAIAAEQEREAVFAGRSTTMIHGGSSWAAGVADAILHDAQGRHETAATAREAAFAQAPDVAGTIDDVRFDWIADADARFGPCIEAIIGGRYGLLPFDAITGLKSEGPKDLRDIVWYPVELALKAGTSVAALLPARYPGIGDDAAERMARATGWNDGPNGQIGSGQHLWTLSDGEDHGLLSIRSLVLD